MSDPLVIAAALTSAGGVIVAIITFMAKMTEVLQEVSAVKHKTQGLVQKLEHETAPNHGTSLKDSLNRIEGDLRGMKRDVGRLADADLELHETKSRDHKAIHDRMDRLAVELEHMREKNNVHH